MTPRAPFRILATTLLGVAAGALFGAGDAARALLRPGSVLAGSALPSSVLLHAVLGLVGGLVLSVLALPWRHGEATPRAAVWVGTPVAFGLLIANVDWLPAFLAPVSLSVDAVGIAMLVAGIVLLAPRLGPPRPVVSAGIAVSVIAASFLLPFVWPAEGDGGDEAVVTGVGGPAVVVVVIDTLRADALGTYGAKAAPDPRLRALAEDGIVFENVRAASTWTKPSTASILTGLHPAVHGAILHDQTLSPEATTLAEILRAAGYRTAAFSANPWVSPTFGFGQGFDRFEVRRPSVLLTGTLIGKAVSTLRLRFKNPVTGWLYRGLRACDRLFPSSETAFEDEPSGATLVERALRFVDDGRGRFFLYLHLMEPHAPYTPPPEFAAPFDPGGEGPAPDRAPAYTGMLPWDTGDPMPPGDLARLRGAYDGEVAAADAAVGRLIDGLEARAVLHETVLCVLADHGEEFHEHGAWGHGHSLHDEVAKVPWILRLPRRAHAGRRVAGAVSTVDVLPTLLDLLGLRVLDAAREPNGLSLAAALRGEAEIPEDRIVFSEVTSGAETLRMAATASRALTTHEGRGDAGSTLTPPGAPAPDLERALEEAFDTFRRTALRSGRAALGEDERDQLRGIGYLR